MLYLIVSTVDGHIIDFTTDPDTADARSWWRDDAVVVVVNPALARQAVAA